ncbi:MAG: helix-turn-helix domain-containing protein, partial [Thaumarchaeota archaeon]|nr:helix-turn-helix domain-containing protein [Nitrososphaerota archaeon]
MARGRPSLPQLKKYDVTQKVIAALVNVESRAILFDIVRAERSAPEISARLRIPMSTTYGKIAELEGLALVSGRLVRTDGGSRMRVYRSRIRGAEIHVRG